MGISAHPPGALPVARQWSFDPAGDAGIEKIEGETATGEYFIVEGADPLHFARDAQVGCGSFAVYAAPPAITAPAEMEKLSEPGVAWRPYCREVVETK
jgi:hypothetical protein